MATQPLNMEDVDEETFGAFYIWSFQELPSLGDTLGYGLEINFMIKIARFATTYKVFALKKQVADVFRQKLVEKTWRLEPDWVLNVYLIEDQAPDRAWIYRLIEDATGTLGSRFQSRTDEEMKQWCAIGQRFPSFWQAFIVANGTGRDLSHIKFAEQCRYHDHGQPEPRCGEYGTDVSCLYPESMWMLPAKRDIGDSSDTVLVEPHRKRICIRTDPGTNCPASNAQRPLT